MLRREFRVMPRGPQGQRRPADAVALAVMVGRIATGEVEDDVAVGVPKQHGVQGGLARSAALPSERKSEIARAASAARWS